MMNESSSYTALPISDVIAFAALIVAGLAFFATAWQAYLAHRQFAAVRADLEDAKEARRGKIYKLKRAVRALYDACQNIPALPDFDREEVLAFNHSRLTGIEASSDTFFFREINDVPLLRSRLEELDQASQDAQEDLLTAQKSENSISDTDLRSAADQLHKVYRLAGECDQLLSAIG